MGDSEGPGGEETLPTDPDTYLIAPPPHPALYLQKSERAFRPVCVDELPEDIVLLKGLLKRFVEELPRGRQLEIKPLDAEGAEETK